MSRATRCKYSFLRDWLMPPNPRTVVLECIPSRSGMCLSVYDRSHPIFRVNGCGFDRIGTALGQFIEALFPDELANLAKDSRDIRPYGTSWSTGHRYGMAWDKNFRVSLDGGCGVESMARIAEELGLHVQLSESRHGTLICISRKEEGDK